MDEFDSTLNCLCLKSLHIQNLGTGSKWKPKTNLNLAKPFDYDVVNDVNEMNADWDHDKFDGTGGQEAQGQATKKDHGRDF